MFKYAVFTPTEDDGFEVTFTSTLKPSHNADSMGVYAEDLTPPDNGLSGGEASQWLRDQLRIYGSLDEFVAQRTRDQNPHEQTNLDDHIGPVTPPQSLQNRTDD